MINHVGGHDISNLICKSMKKKRMRRYLDYKIPGKKCWCIMRLVLLFTVGIMFQVSAAGLAQTVKMTGKQQTLKAIFEQVEQQTGKVTLFSNNELNMNKVVKLNAGKFTLEELYRQVLQGTNLGFEISETYVVIRQLPLIARDSGEVKKSLTIKGIVRDVKKQPLPGVTVLVKGSTLGVSTSEKGVFKIEIPNKDVILVFSFVGMESKEVKLNELKDKEILAGKKDLEVTLEESVESLEDVVITGYANIRKSSFTGSATQPRR